MKLREKTTATLLIALFMISTFAVAVPVFAHPEVWVDGIGTDPNHYVTILQGIAAVDVGGTVHVLAGTYDEQVVIGKSLILEGVGETTIIQPSVAGTLTSLYTLGTQTGAFWNGYKLASIIEVSGVGTAGVTIKNLKVDGVNINSKPGGAHYIVGISYGETSGTIDDVTVVNMDTTPVTAGIRSYGVWLDSVSTTVLVEVKNSEITLYNKNGINARGAQLTADIHDNIVTGPGESPCVPNGILFISGVAGTASMNTITNHHYASYVWTACGIATWDVAGIVIEKNTISDSGSGIGLSGYSSWNQGTTGSTIQENTITNTERGIYLECPDTTYNIITENDILDNVYGIYLAGVDSPTYDGGEEVGQGNEAHHNNIAGNTVYGVAMFNPNESFDATLNWWGHASGPGGPDGRINRADKIIGQGDGIFGPVTWDPWLPQPVFHTPHDPLPPGLLE